VFEGLSNLKSALLINLPEVFREGSITLIIKGTIENWKGSMVAIQKRVRPRIVVIFTLSGHGDHEGIINEK